MRPIAAQKLGYEQSPVTFGHVEGELMLPPARMGERWKSAFPHRSPITVTRDFSELAHFGIRDEVLEAWKERYPAGLNKLQLAAVNEHNVLGGESLLCVAPTSAGKTFVGELAAVRAVMEGKKAVFLLPFRALVNEKFEDFTELYGTRLGLRIARCSGDWQDQVGDVLRNKYDIAFFTYEKFLAMVAASPYLLNQLGLVVLDEAQFITEPGRGMSVELLLTHLVRARNTGVAPQLIALSAVIGDTNQFERWLGCRLLHSTERPVPLREGVIGRDGVWHFAGLDGQSGSEGLIPPGAVRVRGAKPSSQDVIVPLVRRLVPERDEDYTPQVRGPGEASWQVAAAQRFGPALSRLLRFQARQDRDYYARCKRALIVQDWIDGSATGAIEAKYSANAYSRVGHGDVRGFADGCRMLLDSVVRIAAIVRETAFDADSVATLQKRLEVGVPAELLQLVNSKLPLTRGQLLALRAEGVLSLAGIAALSTAQAQRLFAERADVVRRKAASLHGLQKRDATAAQGAPGQVVAQA